MWMCISRRLLLPKWVGAGVAEVTVMGAECTELDTVDGRGTLRFTITTTDVGATNVGGADTTSSSCVAVACQS